MDDGDSISLPGLTSEKIHDEVDRDSAWATKRMRYAAVDRTVNGAVVLRLLLKAKAHKIRKDRQERQPLM